ncbi:MAG: hypothetical protein C0616_04955 [Desulfuromonas sp.]|nr:MAG: hypothetical protein C0616_04955 [Desulfuromonas sp.]
MVVGFNHNFKYKGVVYHVQTEDGGLKSPQIVTLLYQGGTILSSKKTSYADIAKVDNLEKVVEELMKEQHKEMLRRLKDGEFDHLLGEKSEAEPEAAATPVAAETVVGASPVVVETEREPDPPDPPEDADSKSASDPREEKKVEDGSEKKSELDDIIFSYLAGDE